MNDTISDKDALPQAQINNGNRFSLVWLLPIIAIVIGGWLIYKALSEKGPTVEVSFHSAEGIEAGKTRIRYKDVDIGKVKEIQLNDDLSQVIITAELKRSIGTHLNENTRFWIVRPRISASGISGLSTLVSGIYIAMDPGQGQQKKRVFQGLEAAPPVKLDADGSSFQLEAKDLSALDIGSPVYFRQIKVGEVTNYDLDDNNHNVSISIFINAPYHELVHKHSYFWNVSGIEIDLNASGVTASVASLAALAMGGIAFETPFDLDAGSKATIDDRFFLYPSRSKVATQKQSSPRYYEMQFDGSLRGLSVGAPVEYRGIKIGEVINIDLLLNQNSLDVAIPVLVAIYPQQATLEGDAKEGDSFESFMDQLVDRGLRAQLKSGSLLTGQLFVELSFVPDAPPAKIDRDHGHAKFPTIPATMDKLARNATDFIERIQQIPVVDISKNLDESIAGLNQLINAEETQKIPLNINAALVQLLEISNTLNQDIQPITRQLLASLKQMETTLETADTVIAEDSPLYYEIRQMVEEMTETAESFESLTDYLQRNPSALLYGKTGDKP